MDSGPYKSITEWQRADTGTAAARQVDNARVRATLDRIDVLDRKCLELEQACKAAQERIEQLEEGCHVAVWGERSR